MSRAEQGSREGASRDRRHTPPREAGSVAAFLRALAERAERDPAFARQLSDALRQSGLVPAEPLAVLAAPSTAGSVRGTRAGRAGNNSAADPPLDPFVVLRAGGEPALRETLDGLDLAALRRVVRAFHLDPNRVSARWSARERVIGLIVEQVRARANHGRSFERV